MAAGKVTGHFLRFKWEKYHPTQSCARILSPTCLLRLEIEQLPHHNNIMCLTGEVCSHPFSIL